MFALELRSIERNCCYNLVGDRHHQLMLRIRKLTWNTWEWLLHFLPGRNQLSSDWRGDLSIFGTCSINRIPIRIGTIGWKYQVPYISEKCCVRHCKRSIKLLNMSHILLKGVGGDVEWWGNMPMSVWLEFIYGTFNWRMMKCTTTIVWILCIVFYPALFKVLIKWEGEDRKMKVFSMLWG